MSGGLIAAAVISSALLDASALQVCLRSNLPENTPAINARFARNLVAAAAYIDVAVAESARPVDQKAYLDVWLRHELREARNDFERRRARSMYAQKLRGPAPAYHVVYRVVKRLKGRSPDRFELRAAEFDDWKRAVTPLRHHKSPNGSIMPQGSPPEASPTRETAATECGPGAAITASRGSTYLIFRDAAGRLLGPTLSQRPGGPLRTRSYVYQSVRADRDPWVLAVERSLAR